MQYISTLLNIKKTMGKSLHLLYFFVSIFSLVILQVYRNFLFNQWEKTSYK